MKINGSTALVTGANRGIGREMVRELLRRDVRKVYAAVRNPDAFAMNEIDYRVEVVPLDVTRTETVGKLALLASDVTLLLNNAGVLDFADIVEAPLSVLQRNFDTNFYGKLTMARAFAPVIEGNGGGAIVNMLTLVALASMPSLAVYNASKAAAWSMTQSLRASLASRGVAVHGVFPGAVDTEMLAGVDMPKTNPADVAAAVLEGVEQDREDIFPDPMSRETYAAWMADHKAVERKFASM